MLPLALSNHNFQLDGLVHRLDVVRMRISTSNCKPIALSQERMKCPLQVGNKMMPQVKETLVTCSLEREEGKGRLMDSVVRCPHQWQQSLGDEIRDTSRKLPPNGVLVQP